jgi:hypothetical protein
MGKEDLPEKMIEMRNLNKTVFIGSPNELRILKNITLSAERAFRRGKTAGRHLTRSGQ